MLGEELTWDTQFDHRRSLAGILTEIFITSTIDIIAREPARRAHYELRTLISIDIHTSTPGVVENIIVTLTEPFTLNLSPVTSTNLGDIEKINRRRSTRRNTVILDSREISILDSDTPIISIDLTIDTSCPQRF